MRRAETPTPSAPTNQSAAPTNQSSAPTDQAEGSTTSDLPDWPAWLVPLVAAFADVTAEQLSHVVPPPPASARSSAVLMLFAEGAAGPDLLLTERSPDLRSHPGQLSFPGGSADPGDTGPVDTALREAAEEVGLRRTDVDVIGCLPALWVPPSNHAVTTVLAWWRRPGPVDAVDPAEVASVLRVPLSTLVDPAQRFTVRHPSGWKGPAFEVDDGLLLWGFTAGVVARLFDLVGWSRPWDTSRERALPRTGAAR